MFADNARWGAGVRRRERRKNASASPLGLLNNNILTLCRLRSPSRGARQSLFRSEQTGRPFGPDSYHLPSHDVSAPLARPSTCTVLSLNPYVPSEIRAIYVPARETGSTILLNPLMARRPLHTFVWVPPLSRARKTRVDTVREIGTVIVCYTIILFSARFCSVRGRVVEKLFP